MYKVVFKAGFAHASKEEEDKYLIVGLSEDEFDYDKYIIFQKSYDPKEPADIFIDCNGDQCVNCCTYISVSNTAMLLHVADSEISIDIDQLALPVNFRDHLKHIFGNLLEIKD